MKPGMVLCIEPMITLGTHRVRVLGMTGQQLQ